MPSKVGPKGQVVIEKEIRDRLGLGPGWLALQRLVNDHVEIYFLPPRHRKSLKGILAPHTSVHIAPGQEWDEARERAWKAAAEDEAGQVDRSL